jgi:hypothetical protein
VATKKADAAEPSASNHHLPDGLSLSEPVPQRAATPRPLEEALAPVPEPDPAATAEPTRAALVGPNGGLYSVETTEEGELRIVALSELRAQAEG